MSKADSVFSVATRNPFTNVYGLGRTLLALGTLLTMVFSDTNVLFRPALGIEQVPIINGFAGKISLFTLFAGNLSAGKAVAMLLLALVASGWKPRYTGLLHWWVSYSFMNSCVLVDGGDQVTAILTLLLVPVTLCDARTWHWGKALSYSTVQPYLNIIGNTTVALIRMQVAIIYLHAAVAKCSVPEWENGTALYYWFTDPMFGHPAWLNAVLDPLLDNPFSVTVFTWSIIVLEFLLFSGLLANRKVKPWLLGAGLIFHAGIAVIHGLTSFALAMSGALILFLRPAEQAFARKRSKPNKEKHGPQTFERYETKIPASPLLSMVQKKS